METAEQVSAFRWGLFRLARMLRRQNADMGLPQTAFHIVALLGRRQNLLPSEIAQEEKISAQAISQNLNALEQQGLIIRNVDAGDRRKILISLSEKGRELLEKVKHERDAWLLDTMQRRLSPDECKALLSVTDLLHKLTTDE